MGVVWRGHDRATGAVYAVKVVRPEYARDPAAVGRFVRERTVLVAFRHPNVVTVHDMIVEGDQLALVMELVSGGDLDGLRRARGGSLAAAEAASLVAQVADGLAAAHAAGIVHRDLKPANVLFSVDRVLLADFGIALLAGYPRVTSEGQLLGTATYLAPEVIAGQEPGPAGDVYALGVTLYELLAGQPPFTGNTAAVLYAHGTAAPPRVAGLPDDIWGIVAACLAKDPAARPLAAEVAVALHASAAAPAALAAPPGAAGWTEGLQLWPDPLQAVPTAAIAAGATERPPLATAPVVRRRKVPAVPRRTMVITAVSAAAALLVVAMIMLNPFRSGTPAQRAEFAGAGQPDSQSSSSAAARPGRNPGPGSSRTSGTGGASGQPASGASPGVTGTSRQGKPSAAPGPTGPGSRSSAPAAPSSAAPSSSAGASSAPGAAVTDADGFPILDASTGAQAHTCTVLGSAADSNIGQTVQGVVCADLLTAAGSGGYTVKGQLELVCETPAGADVQCADVIAKGELANAAAGVVATTGSYQCGHSYGACATGRNYVTTGTYSYPGTTASACSSNGGSTTDAWGLALGGGDTQIELPGSDKWVSLSSSTADDNGNESTGHQYICP